MRRLLIFFASAVLGSAQTAPIVNNVLNGASFAGSLCPGTLAALFGSNLATGTASAPSLPLPTDLLGTKVWVQDPSLPNPIAAPLYFVSPGQINFQIPFEVVRNNVSVSVSTPQGTSKALGLILYPMAPGIFSQTADGRGTALAFDPNFRPLANTAAAGSTVVFYATGLGPTTPPANSGVGGNASAPFNQVANPFDVYIGGNKATVAWAGLAPGFSGVYQVNVVPTAAAVGNVMFICSTCNESNLLSMPQGPVNNGNNTANVSGSVTILYPNGQPPIPWSPAFMVANVTAKFDIKPTAGRFTLSVVATIGATTVDGTTIQFDPVLGQFTANVSAPTSAERLGDFTGTGISATDFAYACGSSSTTCPFPGNIVPLSRQDPNLANALKSVSLPNTARNGIHSFYTVTGGVKPGSTFTLGGSTNVDLTTVASFGAIPYPTADVPVTVTLYIDGQIVGGASTTFKPPK